MRHFHKTLLALAFLGAAVSANAQDSTAPQAAPAAEQAAMLPAGIAPPPAGKGPARIAIAPGAVKDDRRQGRSPSRTIPATAVSAALDSGAFQP